LGLFKYKLNNVDSLDISHTMYEILKINNKVYLKGVFFTKIYCVFSPNYKSDACFTLIDSTYIDLLQKTRVYFDVEQYAEIKKIVEKEHGSPLVDVIEEINKLNQSLIDENVETEKIIVEMGKKFEVINNERKISLFLDYVRKNRKNEDFFNDQNKVVNFFLEESFMAFCVHSLEVFSEYRHTKEKILYNLKKKNEYIMSKLTKLAKKTTTLRTSSDSDITFIMRVVDRSEIIKILKKISKQEFEEIEEKEEDLSKNDVPEIAIIETEKIDSLNVKK
jgi:ribosomal protein S8